MREIKFRGYNKTLKKYVYGNLLEDDLPKEGSIYQIVNKTTDSRFDVDKESIGQYTGFKDKNGIEIYEGDIVTFGIANHIVVWNKNNASFGLMFDEIIIPFTDNKNCGVYEVVGNIYEEKLEVK